MNVIVKGPLRQHRGEQDRGVAVTAGPRASDTGPAGLFTTGSTMRHVLAMTAAGSVGLISVFFVDLLSLLYISRLGDTNLTAAVGYASQVSFLLVSINIGLSVAIGALVSQALGAGDRARARRIAASGTVHVAVLSGGLGLLALPFAHEILASFGARGETLAVGSTYLRMTLPATVFLGIGMAFSAILRGVGDAKRAMYTTLGGALVTACLDPILIFGLHLGIHGAAIVLVISRLSLLGVGWHGAVRVHRLVERPRLAAVWADLRPMATIAAPAVLTNLAAPVSNLYVMHVFSAFGEPVIAAFAIMDRVTPVGFGVLFALSGSVGPIMGQNFGAGAFGRVRKVLTDCYLLAAGYVAAFSAVLWFAAPLVVVLFNAHGATADLIGFFCHASGALWLFLGGVFVANAAYNNLGRPILSVVFNWGRATLGTIPFVTLGASLHGPRGGYLGMIGGAAIFGCLAVAVSYLVVGRLARPVPSKR